MSGMGEYEGKKRDWNETKILSWPKSNKKLIPITNQLTYDYKLIIHC